MRHATGGQVFKNYFKSALRNLARYKIYSVINLAGFSIGLACCLIIALFVRYELSFDRFHPNADRLFRVVGDSINPYEIFNRARTPNPLGPKLTSEFPEVEMTARLARMSNVLIEAEDRQFYEDRFFLADQSIFELFRFDFLEGAPVSSFPAPNSVVITESTARKYFGSGDPLNKFIRFDNRIDFQVSGIVRDNPTNMHFNVDFIAAIQSAKEVWQSPDWATRWETSSFHTYLLLQEGINPEDLESKFPAFVNSYIQESLDDDEDYKLSLQPVTSIHLHSHLSGEIEANSNVQYVYIFAATALIILFIACGNYVNLSTARAATRSKEIGMRKVAGASRGQVIRQFVTESILHSSAALILAWLIVELCLPQFNRLTDLSLRLGIVDDPVFFAIVLISTALVGIASGYYPALFISSFSPAQAVKGTLKGGIPSRVYLRKALIVFQFSASIILLIAFSIVNDQLYFIKNKDLGYNKEEIIVIPLKGQEIRRNAGVIKSSFLQNPAVRGATLSSELPDRVVWNSTGTWEGAQDRKLQTYHIMVDPDFIDLFEIELVDGRTFLKESSDSEGAYILNEAALKAMGWEEAIGKKFTLWGREAEVIGVVRDFHFESLHQKVEPLAFHIRPQWFARLSIKISSENIQETISGLKNQWQAMVPDRPFDYYFFDERFDQMYRAEEKLEVLVSFFAVLAIIVACLGLFGLTTFSAEQRTKEIGIRRVLGACVSNVTALLSKDFIRLILLANVIAWPLAWYSMTEWLQNFAYNIGIDFILFAFCGGLALLIALFTVCTQAIRAAIANPVNSLRYE